MIPNELSKRQQLHEAEPEIVEPFRRVVSVAMRRVREGSIDRAGRQFILLQQPTRLYAIIDVSVERKRRGIKRVVTSTGHLDGGLFISGIQFDESGKFECNLTSIQIPRDVAHTTQDSLFLQRGSDVRSIELLADELETAKAVQTRLSKLLWGV